MAHKTDQSYPTLQLLIKTMQCINSKLKFERAQLSNECKNIMQHSSGGYPLFSGRWRSCNTLYLILHATKTNSSSDHLSISVPCELISISLSS